MEKHSHRIVSKHFSLVKQKLMHFSKHFDIANHGDIKGYGREALASEFLSTHLPDQIEYSTGEIIDHEDNRSGQIDIILQSKFFPKIPLWGNIQLAYSDAVMAVIEVKSNLTTQHLDSVLKSFRKIKALKRQSSISGNSQMVNLKNIPCIAFAFTGPSLQTLLFGINNFAAKEKVSLDEFAPDLVVVLDKDYYLCKNDGWIFPIVPGGYFRDWQGVGDENLVGMYNYLTNITLSYLNRRPGFTIGPYFDKAILAK